MKDPYQTLGIERTATDQEIKSAFRKLALQHHPDRNQNDPKAEERFKEINAAYEVLSDAKKRQQYDQFGNVGPQQQANPNININDLFRGINIDDLFNGGRRSKKSVFKGDDLHKNVSLDFMEAVSGGKKTIKVSYYLECSDCKGTGAEGGTKFSSCGTCGGAGKTGYQQGYMRIMNTCRACSGTGRKIDTKCKCCSGSGQKLKEEKLSIHIPTGIDDGTTMRLTGKGLPGMNGGPAGDLFVSISIQPHPQFNRRGLDILVEENVDYLDALLGAEYQVNTVNGTKKVKIPALTQTGMILRLDGQGIDTGKSKGSHYLSINVRLPEKLSDEEKGLVQKLKGLRGEQ